MLLLLLFVLCTHASWFSWPSWATKRALEHDAIYAMGFTLDDHCGYTRDDALVCIATYIDVNHDKEVSADEFERGKAKFLPPIARKVEWIAKKLGYTVTLADVMWGCDINGDGHLTLNDWKAGAKRCMPHESDLCKFKTVCDNAARIMGHHKNKSDK